MIVAETTATISLGDASVTNDASAAIIGALASQYNTPAVARMGAAVSVTLYRALSVTITLESDMSDEQLCSVLTAALTLNAFDHTCAATSGGSGTTFLLECPLENNLAAVNAKTAEMLAFISDDAEPLPAAMVATASSMRRRQLASLSVSGVEPPTTSLGALVTIVVQQLAAEASAYAAVTESQEEVMAAIGDIDAASISDALAASDALATVAGLAVAEPTVAVALTNAPPSEPPPTSPPVPPVPPDPPVLPPPFPPRTLLLPPPSPRLPSPLPPTTPPPEPPPPITSSQSASRLPPPSLSLPPNERPSPHPPAMPPSLAPPSGSAALAPNDEEIVDDDHGSNVFAPEDIGVTTGGVVGGCLLLAAVAWSVVYLVGRRRGRAAFRSSQRKPLSGGTSNAALTLQGKSTERKSEEDKRDSAFVQITPSLHSVIDQPAPPLPPGRGPETPESQPLPRPGVLGEWV
jgi:hypothetical protein